MYNEGHIKSLRKAIDTMKAQNEVLKEYCTNECHICPLSNMCDWDGNIDFADPKLTDEALDRYVDLHKEVTDARERANFTQTTGIDAGWYDFNDDRSNFWDI
jgi:hypothetical protein